MCLDYVCSAVMEIKTDLAKKEEELNMSFEEKKEIVADILEMSPDEFNLDTKLEDCEAWDSVAVLAVISQVDELYGRLPLAKDVVACKTIQDLIDFIFEDE